MRSSTNQGSCDRLFPAKVSRTVLCSSCQINEPRGFPPRGYLDKTKSSRPTLLIVVIGELAVQCAPSRKPG